MIKRNNNSSVILSSLGQICHKSPLTNRMRQINKLFEQSQRQIFELTYLYTSPHINTDSSFREIVKILQNFNQETQSLNIKPNHNKKISTIQVSCMHLLYQQMLTIAVMGEKELKINNFAAKLMQWYLSLNENNNFMEGNGHAWKKIKLNKQNNMEEKIRQTFKSNVYDEIAGYLRKKVNYSYPSDQEQQEESHQKNHIKNISHHEVRKDYFPNIDTLMYRREQNLMSDIRQKKMEKDYLNTFISNKINNRQNSLNKLHHELLYRNKPAVTEHRDISAIYNSFKYENDLQINHENHVNNSTHLDKKQNQSISVKSRSNSKIIMKSSQKINHTNIMNVNGINIINCKYQ